jgi:hypothetical protein
MCALEPFEQTFRRWRGRAVAGTLPCKCFEAMGRADEAEIDEPALGVRACASIDPGLLLAPCARRRYLQADAMARRKVDGHQVEVLRCAWRSVEEKSIGDECGHATCLHVQAPRLRKQA